MLSKGRHNSHQTSNFPANNSKQPASSGKFWYCLYALIASWVVFLFAFHYLSLQPFSTQTTPQETTQTSTTPQAGPLQKKDDSPMLRFKVDTPIQPKNLPVITSSGSDDDDKIHIVFSTDCSFFQDWQTLLVFHSAVVVQQKGKISRIASGCAEDKQRELTELYKTLFPQYGVHFTPDFKTDGKTKKKYDFYNKPYGLHHWLLNAQPPIPGHTVVILIDPDMILLRPFTLNLANNSLNIFMKGYDLSKENLPEKISRGHPTAQLYGLGAPWAAKKGHKHFNRKEICGEGSPCLATEQRFGELHYR